MSRTIRKVSHKLKNFYKSDTVRDNSRTRVSGNCERNGGCPYCEGNRLHKHRKQVSLKEAIEINNAAIA